MRRGIIEPDGSIRVVPLLEWAEWFEQRGMKSYKEGGHIIARTELPGGVVVSTVFLGLNHRWTDGAPYWFETMIFGGPHDQFQTRSSTFEEAETEHARTVELAKAT